MVTVPTFQRQDGTPDRPAADTKTGGRPWWHRTATSKPPTGAFLHTMSTSDGPVRRVPRASWCPGTVTGAWAIGTGLGRVCGFGGEGLFFSPFFLFFFSPHHLQILFSTRFFTTQRQNNSSGACVLALTSQSSGVTVSLVSEVYSTCGKPKLTIDALLGHLGLLGLVV